MEVYHFALLLAAGFILARGHRWWGDRGRRARRLLRRAKSVPIAAIRNGEWVKVTGVVGAVGPPSISPMSDRECVGFRVIVEKLSRGFPITTTRDECVPFSISDDTGTAAVEGPFLLHLDWDNDWSVVPQEALGFLEQQGVTTEGLLFRYRFAFREALLQPGDRLSVFGLAFLEPDPTEPPAGRSPAFKVHLRGTKEDPVAVADAGKRVSR